MFGRDIGFHLDRSHYLSAFVFVTLCTYVIEQTIIFFFSLLAYIVIDL